MNRTIDVVVLLLEIAVLFFAVTMAVQLFQARFGPDRLQAWMGGHPFVSALKGIALGFVTPFCTFTAVPMLVGLRQARVPPAGYVAFVVAAPVLDPILFGALMIIAGLETALIYSVIAFTAAIGLAMAAEALDIEKHLTPVNALAGLMGDDIECESAAACDAGPGAGEKWDGLRLEVRPASRRAWRLLRGMAPILVAGVALSLVIESAVPPDVTERLTSASPRFSIPIAAALGTPLYVSTTVFVPIAEALQNAGVGIGAIVALTIAGAGANLPEFVILSKLARPRIIGVLFTYVFFVAVVGGFLTQALIG